MLHTSLILKQSMISYNQQYKLHNGQIFARVTKVMYGLPQAGPIANDDKVQHLAPYQYHPIKSTPRIWTHDNRPTAFTLVVNDFGVKKKK